MQPSLRRINQNNQNEQRNSKPVLIYHKFLKNTLPTEGELKKIEKELKDKAEAHEKEFAAKQEEFEKMKAVQKEDFEKHEKEFEERMKARDEDFDKMVKSTRKEIEAEFRNARGEISSSKGCYRDSSYWKAKKALEAEKESKIVESAKN